MCAAAPQLGNRFKRASLFRERGRARICRYRAQRQAALTSDVGLYRIERLLLAVYVHPQWAFLLLLMFTLCSLPCFCRQL